MVGDMVDLYRGIDGGACATLLAKLAVEKSYSDKMDETRNAYQVSFRLLQHGLGANWLQVRPARERRQITNGLCSCRMLGVRGDSA